MYSAAFRSKVFHSVRFIRTSRFCTKPERTTLKIAKLNGRSLLRLSGESLDTFLQGLLTNDVRPIFQPSPTSLTTCDQKSCIYTLMLNTQGRVLYDLFLYRFDEQPENSLFQNVVIDCDRLCTSDLISIFNRYKLRRKITIDNLDESHSVFVVFAYHHHLYATGRKKNFCNQFLNAIENPQHLKMIRPFLDPRLPYDLALRLIVPKNVQKFFKSDSELVEENEKDYQLWRYSLGIPEGLRDLPPGNCFPLESNGDYMLGVNFNKGCYVGQELTARTHHTGVIRKRLMPLKFDCNQSTNFTQILTFDNANIVNRHNESVGKLRGVVYDAGLALLRVEKVLTETKLALQFEDGKTVTCTTNKPFWWPVSED